MKVDSQIDLETYLLEMQGDTVATLELKAILRRIQARLDLAGVEAFNRLDDDCETRIEQQVKNLVKERDFLKELVHDLHRVITKDN